VAGKKYTAEFKVEVVKAVLDEQLSTGQAVSIHGFS
jgi:transposase-like protein